jgi:hypothetical protein
MSLSLSCLRSSLSSSCLSKNKVEGEEARYHRTCLIGSLREKGWRNPNEQWNEKNGVGGICRRELMIR